MSEERELRFREEANRFSNQINKTFQQIWRYGPFEGFPEQDRLFVKANSVKLTKNPDERMILGDFRFNIEPDDAVGRLFSVTESSFRFFLEKSTSPLFSYEYKRTVDDKGNKTIPRAYLSIDALRRSDDRIITSLASMKFPLGGDRLRPCLEDVLLSCDRDFSLGLTDEDRELLKRETHLFRENQGKLV